MNPDAPKGGELSIAASGTFDSLNPYSRKGRAGALTTLQYDSLIESTSDSVGQYYGLLAESLEYDEGRNWVIFHMRPEATFWDGTPVTAEDVVYSHTLFITQGLPSYAQAVSHMVTGAEALDDHTVKFTFNPDVSRRSLIETVGNTPVFSKAWFEADESRRLDEPRLTRSRSALALICWMNMRSTAGSPINGAMITGPRICRSMWVATITTGSGLNISQTRPRRLKGSRPVNTPFGLSRTPRSGRPPTTFPKSKKAVVVKAEIADQSPPSPSGFVFNLGKPQFADKNVRKALALAFNFEWVNESLLFGLSTQRSSFVQGTHIEASDVPDGPRAVVPGNPGRCCPG